MSLSCVLYLNLNKPTHLVSLWLVSSSLLWYDQGFFSRVQMSKGEEPLSQMLVFVSCCTNDSTNYSRVMGE